MSRRELAELVAEARAALEDAVARGAEWEEPAPELPPVPTRTPTRTPAPSPTPAPTPSGPPSLGSRWGAVAERAREAPTGAELGAAGLRRIREDMGDCRRCPLHGGRRNIVFGVGHPEADLAIVGEAPGQREDATGEPFVGPAGEMLDNMLIHVLGLRREQAHILNIVKCRPPRNRNPAPEEVMACRPFLERQLAAIQPKVMVVLGSVALRALFDLQGIKRHRGTWLEYQGIPAMATFHPAYLLRRPEDKRPVFEDLKKVRARYDEVGGRRD